MRESWESGDFWIAYAARCNFAFDAVYWQKIDQRFFGSTAGSNCEDVWKERLDLLSDEEKTGMEELVTSKLEAMKTHVLAWEPDRYTMENIDIKKRHTAKQRDMIDQTNAAHPDRGTDSLG